MTEDKFWRDKLSKEIDQAKAVVPPDFIWIGRPLKEIISDMADVIEQLERQVKGNGVILKAGKSMARKSGYRLHRPKREHRVRSERNKLLLKNFGKSYADGTASAIMSQYKSQVFINDKIFIDTRTWSPSQLVKFGKLFH